MPRKRLRSVIAAPCFRSTPKVLDNRNGILLGVVMDRPLRASIVLALSALVLIGLLLRLHVAWERNHASAEDLAARLVGDETNYDGLARALLAGGHVARSCQLKPIGYASLDRALEQGAFRWPGRVPVYPTFIAATYAALGECSPSRLLYIQAVVGVTAVPLTYLLGRRLLATTPALLAAGMVAFDDLLIGQTAQIYSEVLYTPLLLGALLLLLWALRTARPGSFAWAGASMAVVTLCRPTTGLIPLVLPVMLPKLWSLTLKGRVCLVYGLTMAAVIAPWTYHNWRAYHRFLPLNVSAGILWLGSPEFYHLVERDRRHLDIWANELNPCRNGGHDPFSIDGDRYFNRRAIQSIREEPVVYVIYSLQKAAYFWLGNPAAEWGYMAFAWWRQWHTLRQWYPYAWPRLFNMLLARELPLIALAALIFLVARRRVRPLLPLLVVGAYIMLIHMLTWSELRYSGPLHPLLAIVVMAAGQETISRRSPSGSRQHRTVSFCSFAGPSCARRSLDSSAHAAQQSLP